MVFVIDATVGETDAVRVVDAILDRDYSKGEVDGLSDGELAEAVRFGLLPDTDRAELWARVQAIREAAEHDRINVYTDGYVDVLCGDEADVDWEGDDVEGELSDCRSDCRNEGRTPSMGALIAAHYFELDPHHFPAMNDVALEFKEVV